MHDVAEAVRAQPRARPQRAIDLLLDGLATRFTDGYAAGVVPLRRALDALWQGGAPGDDDRRWLWLACCVAPEPVAPELWDDEMWHRLTARAVTLARDYGALTVLAFALNYRASVHIHAGEFAAASKLNEEADAISRAAGNAPPVYAALLLAVWRGRESEASQLVEAEIRQAGGRGEGRAIGLAEYATAVLYNGLGRYEDAFAAAQRACEDDDLGFFGWALVELVEAAARSGSRDEARAALGRLEQRTRLAGTDWALGMRARSRALLSDGETSEPLYREAIERLGRTRITVHAARARLLYGEWLRRENRRGDAREQLRAAHDLFSHIGAEAFAERTRRELSATGETVRKRTAETLDELTAQEAQVARLARDGHTNPEIAAKLFLSPRTVEYHLRKVFMKLDITSRRQLQRALPGVETTPVPA